MEATDGNEAREHRAVRNQAMFRSLNERLRVAEQPLADLSGVYEFVCECIDTSCVMRIELTLAEYEDVRTHHDRFAVARGHVYPDVERLVETHDRYDVVEKFHEGSAAALETHERLGEQAV
jgi:hypothetical protein